MIVRWVRGLWIRDVVTYVARCGAKNPQLGWWTIDRSKATCLMCLGVDREAP